MTNRQLMGETIGFDAPDLWSRLESMQANPERYDELDFGLIGMDLDGMVQVYNRTEATVTGTDQRYPIGLNFFDDVGPCSNNYLVRGRFDAEAKVDETIPYVFTLRMDPTPVRLRLLKNAAAGRQYLAVRR